ncbi:MAG TPA: mechanosensitive ion channel domain-containing protein [Thermoanaerobaculia bacterium]|nr:mechanosensitive ion channel domain-containing protein [Thermoanaerobaculia bacterium]
MSQPLALFAGLGTFALLAVVLLALGQRFFLVRQLAFPFGVAALAAALHAAGQFDIPQRAEVLAARDWALLFLGLAFVLRLLSLYFVDVYLRGRGVRLPPLLPAAGMFVIYTLTALISLRLTFPGFDVRPLLATSAVTSLVLGLALQPILGNFFAGLVISLEKPFRLNDWIKLGDQEGRVVAITWRTTHLRTRENDYIVIPNSKISDERILNYYYPHPMHLERVRVGASYKDPPYRVRRALLACAAGVPGVLDNPAPDVQMNAFQDSEVLYELRVWTEDVVQAPRIASDLRARIWEEFQRAGITIPFPMRTLEIAPRRRASKDQGDQPPRARLYVAEGNERGQTLELDPAAGATLGRSRTCTLPLGDSQASKEHLRIEWTPEGYLLTDLGSSFGTRLNGQPVTTAHLRPLDRIAVGDTVLVFESDGG